MKVTSRRIELGSKREGTSLVVVSAPVTPSSVHLCKERVLRIAKFTDEKEFRRLLAIRLRDREWSYLTVVSLCGISEQGEAERQAVAQAVEADILSVLRRVEKSCAIYQIGSTSFLLLHGVDREVSVSKVIRALLQKFRAREPYIGSINEVLVFTLKVSVENGNTSQVAGNIFHILSGIVRTAENNVMYITEQLEFYNWVDKDKIFVHLIS